MLAVFQQLARKIIKLGVRVGASARGDTSSSQTIKRPGFLHLDWVRWCPHDPGITEVLIADGQAGPDALYHLGEVVQGRCDDLGPGKHRLHCGPVALHFLDRFRRARIIPSPGVQQGLNCCYFFGKGKTGGGGRKMRGW